MAYRSYGAALEAKLTEWVRLVLNERLRSIGGRSSVEVLSRRSEGIDATAEVEIGGKKLKLAIEAMTGRHAHQIAPRALALKERARNFGQALPVIVSPEMSGAAKNLLRSSGIGFITLTGDMHLRAPGVYIDRESPRTSQLPVRKPGIGESVRRGPSGGDQRDLLRLWRELARELSRRRDRSVLPFPFGRASSRILRVLFEDDRKEWNLRGLSQAGHASLRTTLLVVNHLAERQWLDKIPGRLRLTRPHEVIRHWRDIYVFRKLNASHPYYAPARTLAELVSGLARVNPEDSDYALTLYAAGELVAPYLRGGEWHVYVRGDPATFANAVDARPVERGANLFLVSPYDASVFMYSRDAAGAKVVSSLQLYLDLYSYNDRTRELAERLAEKEWQWTNA